MNLSINSALSVPASNADAALTAKRWASLKLYNLYRLIISIVFLVGADVPHWNETNQNIVPLLLYGYLVFSIVSAIFTWLKKPRLETLLSSQIILDVIFIVLIMHTEISDPGVTGLLLIIAIASASLISEGRFALFYASVATISILLEQTYSAVQRQESINSYTGSVVLSLACFAIAWLAYSLAKRTHQSELLASQRGLDLQNLAQVNALITQEMQAGVLVVDKDFEIKHHNIQAEVLLGLENEIWLKKSLLDISPEIADLLQNWLKTDESEPLVTANHILKINAQSRELRVSFSAIDDNKSQGTVVFIEDWSQMQTQAHQVKLGALGRLTANIAHEIRNPLSAISHANQLLQEDESASAENKRMLQIISDNVQRVDQIIKDVLELNRRDRTNQELILLASFIPDFYHQFCAVEKIPESHFQLLLDATEANILFDRRHLNQILWNLCKNGWRHSKQNENSLSLHVQISLRTKTVIIEIRDDGKGIPEEQSAHLFEPFFTTEKTGTGLGLYIARELAEANGAKLQFKTTTTGNQTGTQFNLLIKKA